VANDGWLRLPVDWERSCKVWMFRRIWESLKLFNGRWEFAALRLGNRGLGRGFDGDPLSGRLQKTDLYDSPAVALKGPLWGTQGTEAALPSVLKAPDYHMACNRQG
jgi:hypothetical protein